VTPSLGMFCLFMIATLLITVWASARNTTSKGFYTANREIGAAHNGWAIAGDYMSAASFLGITGLIAFYGFDGFMYSVGWLVAYLTVLFLVAEPSRNVGKYTMGDLISFRLRGHPVRAAAAASTLVIALIYMVAQIVGAGSVINLLIPQLDSATTIVAVGIIMLVYVVFGGMLATTWVQIVKAALLMAASLAMSFLVLLHFGFSLPAFFHAAAHVHVVGTSATHNLLQPGLRFSGAIGKLDLISLGLALVLGTAGLPHVLMRFYTVPSAKAARASVAWAMAVIGVFYLTTTFMGLGAATLIGPQRIGIHLRDAQALEYIAHHTAQAHELNAEFARDHYLVPQTNTNLAAPLLARELGGDLFMSFVVAIAFATILAVVAGLTISASSAIAHDVWWNIVRAGRGDEREQVVVARTVALVVGALAILLSLGLRSLNVAFLVGLAFAVAASANVPVIVLSLFWRRFNRAGALAGMTVGLASSVVFIAISPAVMAHPIFPLENPGLVSIPLAFLAAVLGSLLTHDPASQAAFNELNVRANTGIGAEI